MRTKLVSYSIWLSFTKKKVSDKNESHGGKILAYLVIEKGKK